MNCGLLFFKNKTIRVAYCVQEATELCFNFRNLRFPVSELSGHAHLPLQLGLPNYSSSALVGVSARYRIRFRFIMILYTSLIL